MRRGKIGGRETANAGLEPYPDYKPSGVEWLGDAPAHWEMRRLKMAAENVVRQTRGRGNGEIYIALEHVESWTGKIRKADPDAGFDSQVKQFRAGDVLFGKLRPYLAKVARPAESGACVGEFLVLRPRADNLTAGYLEQLLRSKPIIDAVDASTFGAKMPRADWRFIGNLVLPLPPPAEQAAIARYLDRVNERIHRCIDAGERLIGLLKEKRRAVIHQAVTRGLDPDVRLKPSGVEWLGDVPAHWEVRRLKYWVGINEAALSETTSPSYEFHYLDIGAIGVGVIIEEPKKIRFDTAPSRARRIIRNGDTIISTVRTYLKAVWFAEETNGDLICSTGFVVLTPKHNTVPKFVSYIAQSNSFTDRVTAESVGIAYPAITESQLSSFHVCIPPLVEQAAIAAHLDKAVDAIDDAVAGACRWIELLREYRVCLAANVVTGKLDVRETAANLPDGAGESAVLS